MKRIHIYLTEEQIKALDAEAARTGLKRSEIVRRWIDCGIYNGWRLFVEGIVSYRQCGDYAATVVIPKEV